MSMQEVLKQPMREVNLYMFWYFVAFVIFAVFGAFNLLVGVLAGHINATGKIAQNFMSEKQIKQADLMKNKIKEVAEPPAGMVDYNLTEVIEYLLHVLNMLVSDFRLHSKQVLTIWSKAKRTIGLPSLYYCAIC